MKKLGLIVKQASEKEIKENIKASESLIIIKYSGLSSPDMTSLRQALCSSRARMLVVKNSVARRAFRDSGLEHILKTIDGPCGLVFVKDEPVDASKALFSFAKDHEKLKLEGGVFKDKVLERKDIEALAKLPTKGVLRAQVTIALKSPINGLVFVLKGNLRKLVICLEEIRKKKTG